MTSQRLHFPLFLIFLTAVSSVAAEANLTCYQCTKYKNEECDKDRLLPCPSNKDLCVTHISNDAQNGFVLKRECGLGPCGFEDPSAKRGLGMDGCDRSKADYFCVFCCAQSGCNKASAATIWPSVSLLTAMAVLVLSVSTRGSLQHVNKEITK